MYGKKWYNKKRVEWNKRDRVLAVLARHAEAAANAQKMCTCPECGNMFIMQAGVGLYPCQACGIMLRGEL